MSDEKVLMSFASRLTLAIEDLLSNEDSEFHINVSELEEGQKSY